MIERRLQAERLRITPLNIAGLREPFVTTALTSRYTTISGRIVYVIDFLDSLAQVSSVRLPQKSLRRRYHTLYASRFSR